MTPGAPMPATGTGARRAGVIARLMALLALLVLAACAAAPTSDTSRMRYLALGDSYTIGEGVPRDARWPDVAARALRADGVDLADPHVIATTGWTTDELSAAMDASEPLGQWELVTLLIGVNNQYRGRSVAEYQAEFTALLARAIALAGGRAARVVVVSIPDWGATPFGADDARGPRQIASEIDAYNTAAQAIAVSRGVAFVDITTASRADGTHVVDDRLHPSAAMHATWARAVAPALRAALATP